MTTNEVRAYNDEEGLRWRKAMIWKMLARARYYAGYRLPVLREELEGIMERYDLREALDSFHGALE